MIDLPDVNILVALLDDLHVHHRVAKIWFDSAVTTGWATCPLTISGTLRVLSRPQVTGTFPVSDARDLVVALVEANINTHHFWSDAVDLLDIQRFDVTELQGYRQVTDLHHLALANQYHGALVTLTAEPRAL